MLPHLAPVGVLSALGRVSIFITLQPESKPIQIPLVSGQLVPGLELLVGFVRKDIKIGPMITYQRDRVIQGMDILLLRHLHQDRGFDPRSEEHTSELQSLMRISYAVFCLTKK